MSAMAGRDVPRQLRAGPAPEVRFCRELIPDLRHTAARVTSRAGLWQHSGSGDGSPNGADRASHAEFLADSMRTGRGHTPSELHKRPDSHVEAELHHVAARTNLWEPDESPAVPTLSPGLESIELAGQGSNPG